jgi:tungstate transport system permease protein
MDYLLQGLLTATGLLLRLDTDVWAIVATSMLVSVAAVLIASSMAIPLGVFTATTQFRGRRALLQSLNTLMAIPTVVVGLLLYGLLSRRGALGDLDLLYTPWAIIIGEAVLILPIIWNMTVTAISGTDPRLALTCRVLGANAWQQTLLFVREARFGIVAAVVMGFGRAIGEVGIAMMLGGNIAGFTRTMTTAIALETSKGEFELALALGIVLLASAFIVNLALQRLQRDAR